MNLAFTIITFANFIWPQSYTHQLWKWHFLLVVNLMHFLDSIFLMAAASVMTVTIFLFITSTIFVNGSSCFMLRFLLLLVGNVHVLLFLFYNKFYTSSLLFISLLSPLLDFCSWLTTTGFDFQWIFLDLPIMLASQDSIYCSASLITSFTFFDALFFRKSDISVKQVIINCSCISRSGSPSNLLSHLAMSIHLLKYHHGQATN